MYVFAVALEDRSWHHERSYTAERAHRASTVALWHKVRTVEDPEWTRRYHSSDPAEKAFGGRVEITMADGSSIVDEIAVADAHRSGLDLLVATSTSISSDRLPKASSCPKSRPLSRPRVTR